MNMHWYRHVGCNTTCGCDGCADVSGMRAAWATAHWPLGCRCYKHKVPQCGNVTPATCLPNSWSVQGIHVPAANGGYACLTFAGMLACDHDCFRVAGEPRARVLKGCLNLWIPVLAATNVCSRPGCGVPGLGRVHMPRRAGHADS